MAMEMEYLMRIAFFVVIALLCSCGKENASAPQLAECLKAANERRGVATGIVIEMEPECAAIYHPENVPL